MQNQRFTNLRSWPWLILFIRLLLEWPATGAEALALWPGAVPGDFGVIGPELALTKKHVPPELHIFGQGGHGFGVRSNGLPCSPRTDCFVAWLQNQGMLGTNTASK